VVFFVIAIGSAWEYGVSLDRLTFWYPPAHPTARYVAGTVLTPKGQQYEPSPEQYSKVVFEFGLDNRDKIWTGDSILHSKHVLCAYYVVTIVSLAGTIFCLTEGVQHKSYKA
jgi:hypothetical protein